MGKLIAVLVLVGVGIWWFLAAPRPEIGCCIADSIGFDGQTEAAVAAVDQSAAFAEARQLLPIELPPYDDAVFQDGGDTALVTGHDGHIWRLDLAGGQAEPVAEVPLMAWGIHEVPGEPGAVYFCSAGSYGGAGAGERPGLYRLELASGAVETLVTRVPDTGDGEPAPVVYGDGAPAPELAADSGAGRPLAVCDNLEVSADGRRIYFSEPFAYGGVSVGDALDEALALARNGRLWRYDLDSGRTRLIAEGFHFINGVLYEPHPDSAREQSLLVTQTSLFQVTRLVVAGPRAGQHEVAIDSLPGTPDGMDRDAAGRIWLAMFAQRGGLLTWVHENAWIKPLVMRLPTELLLSQAGGTGVVVLSPDGARPLNSAFYEGPDLASIASAVPAPDGIYLAHVGLDEAQDRPVRPVQRLPWPPSLGAP